MCVCVCFMVTVVAVVIVVVFLVDWLEGNYVTLLLKKYIVIGIAECKTKPVSQMCFVWI